MHNKLLMTAVLALLLIGVAWKISTDKAPQTEVVRNELYPHLLDRLNDIQRIELRGAKIETVLHRHQEQWTVANRDDFPAAAGTIRRTLLELAAVRMVEPKTTLPDNYARIGVADVGPGGDGILVEMYAANDQKVVSLIVGHAREAGHQDQRYVRRAGEAQSWLVNGELEVTADPVAWLDARIANVDTARVARVEVTPAAGHPVVITKSSAKDNFFNLQDIPAGSVAKAKALVSGLGALLLDLRFNGVAAAAKFADATALRRTVIQTFDGLIAHVDEFEADGKTYARFDFAYDPGIVKNAVPVAPGADDKTPPAAAAAVTAIAPDGPVAAPAAAPPKESTESVEQEAVRLKAATAAWVYVLPDYKQRMLTKRFEDLIQPAVKDSKKPAQP